MCVRRLWFWCSSPRLSLVWLPSWQHLKVPISCEIVLMAALNYWVLLSRPLLTSPSPLLCHKLIEKPERERERDLSHWAQLFPRNSNWIPAASRPNQWSLCARLSEFLSPLDTALSVPCNPGPTIDSLTCYGSLWTVSTQRLLLPKLKRFTADLCLQYG